MKPVLIICALLAGAAVVAVVQAAPRNGQILAYDDAKVVARGAEVYGEYCASCHGATLEGQENWRQPSATGRMPAPPHDETGHTWHHPDALLFDLTKYGVAALVGNGYESDMAGYDGVLSDADIAASLAYIKSTWPARIIARHNAMNAEHAGN